MVIGARGASGLDAGGDDLVVGDGRILEGHVAVGRALAAHSAGGDHEVAALDAGLGGAAGPHSQESVGAQLAELFHGDRGRGPADATGHGRNRFPGHAACEGAVLPAEGHLASSVQVAGDQCCAPRVAWDQHIAADLPRRQAYVVLALRLSHAGAEF